MNATLAALLLALEQVESGGNSAAVGDHGHALGALQIHRVVVQDVNTHYGTDYRWADAHDRDKARALCVFYLRIYCTKKRLGHEPTVEDAARIWNGGPNGWKKSVTEPYWQRVRFHLPEHFSGKLHFGD